MLKLKFQYFGHLIQITGSFEQTMMLGKIEGKRRGQQRMNWLDGITDRHEFEQAPGDGERQGSLICCSPWVEKNWSGLSTIYVTDLEYYFLSTLWLIIIFQTKHTLSRKFRG